MTQPPLMPVSQELLTKDDYYTPKAIFDALGLRFDLDVCAPPGGVPWLPADRFYTTEDDGLAQPWEGRVWMNPPYSKATAWVARFIERAWSRHRSRRARQIGLASPPLGRCGCVRDA